MWKTPTWYDKSAVLNVLGKVRTHLVTILQYIVMAMSIVTLVATMFLLMVFLDSSTKTREAMKNSTMNSSCL